MPALTKPPLGMLNLSSPLARGLLSAIPLFENGGATNAHFHDFAANRDAVLSGTVTPSQDRFGKMIQFNGEATGGGLAQYTTVLGQRNQAKVSFGVLMTRHGTGGGNAFPKLFMVVGTGSGTGKYFWEDFNNAGSAGFGVQWTATGEWTFPNPTADIPTFFVITYDGSSTSNVPIVYNNGIPQTVTQQTAPSGSLDTTDDDTLTLGNHPVQTRTWNGKLGVFYMWGRILTAKEARILSADPFLLFRRSKQQGFGI